MGRVRRRPQVPAALDGGHPVPGLAPQPQRRDAPDGDDNPRRHGLGRHLRPPGRRLRPLLHRRALARPPLREDALRPGRAGPGLPPRLAGDRPPALDAGAGGDGGVRAARPAPAPGRAALGRGRRLRGGGGQVLRLEPGRGARGARPPRSRAGGRRGPVVRRDRGGQLRGIQHPQPAREAADGLLRLFWDERGGGLFTTGSDGEELIVRSKDVYDGATPSANSVASVALLRLGALTGEVRYGEAGERILAVLDRMLAHSPTAVTYALAGVDLVVGGVTEVAVVGERSDLVHAVSARFQPDAVLAWGEPYPSPLWEDRRPGFAYVCRDYACQAPVDDVGGLLAQLA